MWNGGWHPWGACRETKSEGAFCYSSGANRLTSEMCKEFETPFKIPKRKEGLKPMEAAVTV